MISRGRVTIFAGFLVLFVYSTNATGFSQKTESIIERLAEAEMALQEIDSHKSLLGNSNQTAPAPSSCTNHTNCLSCTSDTTSTCGWCGSGKTGKCFDVSTNGTAAGPHACETWEVGYCYGVPCSAYKRCDVCARDPRCGWCDLTGADGKGKKHKNLKGSTALESFCVDGTKKGTLANPKCDMSDWRYKSCVKPMEIYDSSVGIQQSKHEGMKNFWPSTFVGIRSSTKMEKSAPAITARPSSVTVRTMDLEEEETPKHHRVSLTPFGRDRLEPFPEHKRMPKLPMLDLAEEDAPAEFPNVIEANDHGKEVEMHLAEPAPKSRGDGGRVEIVGEKGVAKEKEARGNSDHNKHADANNKKSGGDGDGKFHAVEMVDDSPPPKPEDRHSHRRHASMNERGHHKQKHHAKAHKSADDGDSDSGEDDNAPVSKPVDERELPGFQGFFSPSDWDNDKQSNSDSGGSRSAGVPGESITENESDEKVEKAPEEASGAVGTSAKSAPAAEKVKGVGERKNTKGNDDGSKEGAMLAEKKPSVKAQPEKVDSKISELKAQLAQLEKEKEKTDATEATLEARSAAQDRSKVARDEASIQALSKQQQQQQQDDKLVPVARPAIAQAAPVAPADRQNIALHEPTAVPQAAPHPAAVKADSTPGMGIRFHDVSKLVNGAPLDDSDVSSPVLPPDVDMHERTAKHAPHSRVAAQAHMHAAAKAKKAARSEASDDDEWAGPFPVSMSPP